MPFFFGGRLIALEKKAGGLRPIVIGLTLRRLVSKCANTVVSASLQDKFLPRQLGVGTSGGCEAAVHSVRRFIQSMPLDYVVAKIDFTNAFNALHRDHMLATVFRESPEIYKYCHLAYSSPSVLFFGEFQLMSEEGTQQGDPLGPLLFCLAVQHLLNSLNSSFVAGYMDDFTVGGTETDVDRDVQHIIQAGSDIGLNVNISKCEIIHDVRHTLSSCTLQSFPQVPPQEACLLGCPLFDGPALDESVQTCCNILSQAIIRLKDICSHDALVLLRASFSSPKIQFLLRGTPCKDHPLLNRFDNLLRDGLSSITNTNLSDLQWLQASLPVKDGGLGMRRVTSLALPCFLASAAATSTLQDAILVDRNPGPYRQFTEYKLVWSDLFSSEIPEPPAAHKQNSWDRPVIECDKATVWKSSSDPTSQRRLAAVSAPHSGDWLHAMPITACGLKLDDEAVRVAVGLRLGVDLCGSHKCPCGALVEPSGSHSFSCKLAFGRMARHHALNDLVYRAFVSANIPVTKEPVGLNRTDGKRPDGLTLIPFQSGRALTWDVTVTHTMAESYARHGDIVAGHAAELASVRKQDKYVNLTSSYLFQPLAFETMGPINSSGLMFLTELGRRISLTSGDKRETSFLFQRLSICIQRFNSVALSLSFETPAAMDS